MNALRIVICDTNPAELDRHAALCRAICERKQIPALFTKFSSSQTLLFEMLDPAFSSAASILVLEPFNGCEVVAEAVRQAGYDGIILYHSWATKKEYFYQAFDAGAYNYVEKGGYTRFETVFESALEAALRLERHYIFLNCAGEYRQIDLRDIYYFEPALNHMICVWYKTGKFLFQDSLSNLEKRLKGHGFIRIHRSYLVALNAVYRAAFDQVTLVNKKIIPVGRGNYAALKEALDKWSRI
ncbi:MAG: LytTR family transcriptional regulator DNA-binding domain-containing protein [Oscillospiraceae bacterium]|nr:LytTR family transcriptional regulator DNA-binding domain-containing protein [Oscillospiraceae bacterium]